ncbi:hypothetical protein KC957_03920, partial [Candidatus Saccharibacteria bacterium]|nr:hypothetical protein [Candidatus Saccharibacteria bacterium]
MADTKSKSKTSKAKASKATKTKTKAVPAVKKADVPTKRRQLKAAPAVSVRQKASSAAQKSGKS